MSSNINSNTVQSSAQAPIEYHVTAAELEATKAELNRNGFNHCGTTCYKDGRGDCHDYSQDHYSYEHPQTARVWVGPAHATSQAQAPVDEYGSRIGRKTSNQAHEYTPRRWNHRSTNYERGIIATMTVDALEGGNRAKKVTLKLTHYNSTVGHKIWFNGMMVRAAHIGLERVELTHFDTFRGQNLRKLSVVVSRKAWDKFTAKADKTEKDSTRNAMEEVDLTVEGVKRDDLPPAPPPPVALVCSNRKEFPVGAF